MKRVLATLRSWDASPLGNAVFAASMAGVFALTVTLWILAAAS